MTPEYFEDFIKKSFLKKQGVAKICNIDEYKITKFLTNHRSLENPEETILQKFCDTFIENNSYM